MIVQRRIRKKENWITNFLSFATNENFEPFKDISHLTQNQTIPCFNVPEEEASWKHCGKRRKRW